MHIELIMRRKRRYVCYTILSLLGLLIMTSTAALTMIMTQHDQDEDRGEQFEGGWDNQHAIEREEEIEEDGEDDSYEEVQPLLQHSEPQEEFTLMNGSIHPTLAKDGGLVLVDNHDGAFVPFKDLPLGVPTVTLETVNEHYPAMISPSDGLVFCPIAKVACAEWRKAFRWMLGVKKWETGAIHEQDKNQIPLLSDYGVKEANRIINDKEWVKFVIVRDPEERLLSGFLNKCNNYRYGYGNCPFMKFMPGLFPPYMKPFPNVPTSRIREYFGKVMREEPEKAFVQWAKGVQGDIAKKGCDVNAHWRPQHCFCGLEKTIDFYHVFSFRNLSTVGVEVAQKLVLPAPERKAAILAFLRERFAFNHDTKEKRRGAAELKAKYFTPEITELVKEAYAEDYKRFSQYF